MSVENPLENNNQGKREEGELKPEIVTVEQMVDYLSSNQELQDKIFGKILDEKELEKIKKKGLQASAITEITKSMGLRTLNKDELDYLMKHAEDKDIPKWEDLYIHPKTEELEREIQESEPEKVLTKIEKSLDNLELELGQLPLEETSKVQWLPHNIQDDILFWKKRWESKEDLSKKIIELENRFEKIADKFQLRSNPSNTYFQLKDKK